MQSILYLLPILGLMWFMREKQGHSSITLYYMNGCRACDDLMPEWRRLSRSGIRGRSGLVTFRTVEASNNDEYETSSYPTIVMRVKDANIRYSGDRSAASIRRWMRFVLQIEGDGVIASTFGPAPPFHEDE